MIFFYWSLNNSFNSLTNVYLDECTPSTRTDFNNCLILVLSGLSYSVFIIMSMVFARPNYLSGPLHSRECFRVIRCM